MPTFSAVCLALLALLPVACGGEDSEGERQPVVPGPMRAALAAWMQYPTDTLRARREELLKGLVASPAIRERDLPLLGRWVETARASRTLAYKTQEAAEAERAAEQYEQAASLARALDWENQCKLVMEWAGFEANARSNPSRGIELARRALDAPGTDDCRERAHWFLAILDIAEAVPATSFEASQQGRMRQLTNLTVTEAGGAGVRASLELTGLAPFETKEQVVAGERTVIMTISHTELVEGVVSRLRVGRGGLKDVRVEVLSEGQLRAQFTLEEEAAHHTFFLTDPFRLVFDVTDQSSPVHGAREGIHVVVLDPGHGGEDLGAESDGLHESQLTLDLARRAATYLEQWLPEARVLLTRRSDEAVSLEDRVAFANEVSADVFVSIHLNGWEEQLSQGGVTTFVLDSTDDQSTLKLAARENGTSVGQVSSMQRLLAGLLRGKQGPESRLLAELVHGSVLDMGRRELRSLPDRGVKSAMFYVLVGARMPAILIEASFLTQHEEREALRLASYRDALAQGLAKGVVSYAQRRESNLRP